MKIYKVTYHGEPGDPDAHSGFTYHCNHSEAWKSAREGSRSYKLDGKIVCRSAKVEPIDVEPTKDGIVAALNLHGGHPDNG